VVLRTLFLRSEAARARWDVEALLDGDGGGDIAGDECDPSAVNAVDGLLDIALSALVVGSPGKL
jgi:hypothetical protein